jgi:CO/xanthine dehydrogenase Mo-binding subunit
MTPRDHTGYLVTRRRWVQTTGAVAGLAVFWSRPGSSQAAAASEATLIGAPEAGVVLEPRTQQSPIPQDVDAYLRINEDGTITLLTGKVEFGQGIRTGLAQLVAEELSVSIDAVEVIVIMGRTDETPFDIGTFGSLSMRSTGTRIR